MFHPRNISTVLRGSGGWLAAALLATAAVLIYANLVWAQQTSTEAAVPAPSLTAEVDNGTVELNWTAVAGAERYELWVWTSADGWQQIGEDNLTDTTYSHTGLTAGTTYYYTVRAVNADGVTGPWSENASATVTTGQTPTPTQTPTSTAMPLISTTPTPTAVPLISTTPTPTAMPKISTTPTPTPSATAAAALSAPVLAAQVTAADTIDLSWGVVADTARYELFTWWNADTGWQKLDDGNLTDTTYSHTGLTAGTTYYYTVRTVNAAGETGPWSEYASATVTTGQTPTPTQTPTSTAMPLISTTPSPTAVPLISTTPTPTAVPLISTTPTPTAMPLISTTPTPTAMPLISTTPTPTPSATAAAALSAPVLSAQVTAADTIDLSWGVVADAARYDLFSWWNADTGWQKLDDGNLTDTTYSHTGLTAGTTYYYTVRTVNAAGETGPWSEYASATVTTGQTPTPTQTPTATVMDTTNWVFAGNVPDADRTALREEVEAVRTWMYDQYGVEARDLTVWVATDAEALADAVDWDIGRMYVPPGYNGPFSLLPDPFVATVDDGSHVIVLIYASNPFYTLLESIAHEYFHVLQYQLVAPRSLSEVEPYWLVEGMAMNFDLAYTQSRSGRRPFIGDNGRFSPYRDLDYAINLQGAMTPGWLRNILTESNFRDGHQVHPIYAYSMAFAGAHFLVGEAGEDSVVEFWRLFQQRPTWQQAFEEAFGMGIEDFYNSFEEWLPDQLPSQVQLSVWLHWPGKEALPPEVLNRIRWATNVGIEDFITSPPENVGWGGSSEEGAHIIAYGAGERWTGTLSLTFKTDPCTWHLLGWYKDGELTDQAKEATVVQFSGESSDLDWTIPARPDTLPSLQETRLPHCN